MEEQRTQKLRLFTAISLPQEVKQGLSDHMKRIEQGSQFTGAHPAWVRADGLHVTLVFLGWCDTSRMTQIRDAMDAAARTATPLSISLGEVELFPSPKNPRVISVALAGQVSELAAIQSNLANGLRERGFDVETRAFRPHLTLARIKSMRGLAGLRDVVKSHARVGGVRSFEVRGIALYRSHMGPGGSRYEEISLSPFAVDDQPPARSEAK